MPIRRYPSGTMIHGAISWREGEVIECLSNPKISFIYLCYNMIKLRGEQWVRDSFEVMKGQSNDIQVIDYDSEDNIKELAKEYGFKYDNIPHVNGVSVHLAKMNNLGIKNAKYDILVRLSPDVVYPQNFAWYISSFFRHYDPRRVFIFFKFFEVYNNGMVKGRPGWEMTFYKPYLIQARGWDERTSYYTGEDKYGRYLMEKVFGVQKYVPPYYFLAHRHHDWRTPYKNKTKNNREKFNIDQQIRYLTGNLNRYKRTVKNSYW